MRRRARVARRSLAGGAARPDLTRKARRYALPHLDLEPADAKIARPRSSHGDPRLDVRRRLEDVHPVADASLVPIGQALPIETTVQLSRIIRHDVADQFDPSRRLDFKPHPNIRVRGRHNARPRDDDPSRAVVPDDATVGRQAGAGMQPHLCRQVRATQARVDAVYVRWRRGHRGVVGAWIGREDGVSDGERRDGGVERTGQ